MNEPEGWEWIEAWRSGTISAEDFARLQELLARSPEARQTLRHAAILDTALRDRSESSRLIDSFDSAARPQPSSRRSLRTRELFAWSAAAIGLSLALFLIVERLLNVPAQRELVEDRSNNPPDDAAESEPVSPTNTMARLRQQMLESTEGIMHLQLVSETAADLSAIDQWRGDIVWSSEQQFGFLRLPCPDNASTNDLLYQLWIVASDSSNQEMIHAGAFPVEQCSGELIVPIQAEHFIEHPRLFIVSVESEGDERGRSTSLLAFTEAP